MKEDSNYLKKVREQYENYPYPYRDPENEKRKYGLCDTDQIFKLNHYLYQGDNNFKNYRILVAGCGTGDSVISLGEQIRDIEGAELVALDMSESSIEIAKKRVEIRRLKNITWIHDSLLELPKMDIGKFDYINCSGVLHHLEKPEEGLAALKSVLAEDGGMGIMIYGKYGRTGVYHIQEIMRGINEGEENLQTKVENTKKVLAGLPETNWWKKSEMYFNDIETMGDIGIYDLFLHSNDLAYSIPELYKFLKDQNLELVCFNGEEQNLLKPEFFIKDIELLKKIQKLEKEKQEAICELICGYLKKHTFICSRKVRPQPQIDNLDMIPVYMSFEDPREYLDICAVMKHSPNHPITVKCFNISTTINPSPRCYYIFKYMDGEKSFKEIFTKVREELRQSITDKELLEDFRPTYKRLRSIEKIYLKTKNGPKFKSSIEIQKYVSSFYPEAEIV